MTLIEGRQILPMFDHRLQQYAERRLKERENFHLINDTVSEVRQDGVLLSDGTFLPCGLVVWSAGLGPTSFSKALSEGMKNKQGQVS